jgi:hypothetical protein
VLFAKAAGTLWEICQRVANNLYNPIKNLPEGCQYPLTPCNKFARGLPTTYGTVARGLPQLHTKGQLFCNTSEESKIQNQNQKAINSYKNFQRFISK